MCDAVAERCGRPVYRWQELSREVVRNGRGRRCYVVRFAVYFGEQGRLL